MRFLGGILFGWLAVVVVAIVLLWMGAYDVSATTPHTEVERRLLKIVQQRGIAVRAADIEPPELDQPERLVRGARTYGQLCATCHGAPGVERSPIGKGINPRPPDLGAAADRWTQEELYFIVSEGIRLAGMPAFGPTLDEQEIWDLVALMESLGRMPPAQYAELLEEGRGF